MPTVLLNFEFFASGDMLLIAAVALLIFGPRKLPEIGRKIGKALAEFRRASDEFKRTWEYEVELEQRKAAPEVEAPRDLAAEAPQLQAEAGTVARDGAPEYERIQALAQGGVKAEVGPAPENEEEVINPS